MPAFNNKLFICNLLLFLSLFDSFVEEECALALFEVVGSELCRTSWVTRYVNFADGTGYTDCIIGEFVAFGDANGVVVVAFVVIFAVDNR